MTALHRFAVEEEPSETIAQGGRNRIVIYDRGDSENSQVVRLHDTELIDLHQTIGIYLEGMR